MQETGNTLLANNAKDADGCRTARGQGAGDLCANIMHDTPSVEDRRGGLKVWEYTRQLTRVPQCRGLNGTPTHGRKCQIQDATKSLGSEGY
jgi:hypothetical protein